MAKLRAVWLRAPATVVDEMLAPPIPLFEVGDIAIDGGASYYRDDILRAAELQQSGIRYVDVGTRGGVAGPS